MLCHQPATVVNMLTKSLGGIRATQFVNGTTQNALAFGHNMTTRSDARIFGADGGQLIAKMAASNDFYQQTCKSLIERMVNTVPKTVQLSDAVTPIKIKPNKLYARVDTAQNAIIISGEIRVSALNICLC